MEQSANNFIQAAGQVTRPYHFPETPFEKIGFALSGGGFRAASYGLGVLSLMNEIKLDSGNSTLLEKIKFISSASGGTITLITYHAAIRKGISFENFYHHLNKQLTGEDLLQEAITILNSDLEWDPQGKSRNLINAFAKAYHSKLFTFLPEPERTLGLLILDASNPGKGHIEEFCFNASEFYTGISFRFQGAGGWEARRGGTFGNGNIGINWGNVPNSVETIKKIRIADVLAASSCFPLGFEPIMFPRDFSYWGGPAVEDLKDAVLLDTYSWDEKKPVAENQLSRRALHERKFAADKIFGLMDGGICDNQGLYSMLEANARKEKNVHNDPDPNNQFDVMMVSDVTSFFMTPYSEPVIPAGKDWLLKTPEERFTQLKRFWKKIPAWIGWGWGAAIVVAVLFLLPLIFERVSVASIVLAVVGFLFLAVMLFISLGYRRLIRRSPQINAALGQRSLQEVFRHFAPADTFTNRVAYKVIGYLQGVKTGIIVQMLLTRGLSASTMIGEVFLKHIRRLIYGELFENLSYKYHRVSNFIYSLSYTNDKNRRRPSFDEPEDEPKKEYEERRNAFYREVEECCPISAKMKDVAEAAYNAGTTLWFEKEQEENSLNIRKAIIATGQFTTCYSLLNYALALKHSRYFKTLDPRWQDRINSVIDQLKPLMIAFQSHPYYLYDQLEKRK